jgi:hypothetical protein
MAVNVAPDGRVTCYWFQRGLSSDAQAHLRAVAATVGSWHYEPILIHGQPQSFADYVLIREEELPARGQPLPAAPLVAYTITLERTDSFYGSGPSYCVKIHGDGLVEYEGIANVAVVGRRTSRIPSDDVARLINEARRMDIWAMRESYSVRVTDMPTYQLTVQVDQQSHRITDYVGKLVGMPPAVTDFEDLVDKIGRTKQWIKKADTR